MTKFNVGDKVRVLNKREILGGGHLVDGYTYRVERLFHGHPVIRGRVIVSSEYHTIELVETNATDRRLTEAEAEIKTLKSKLRALEGLSFGVSIQEAADAMQNFAKVGKQSPNQRRADVIKRAQAFVADIIGAYPNFTTTIGRFDNQAVVATFHVNAEKRTVVALVHGYFSRKLAFKAVAKCAPDDVFNADIGKAIALGRAFGVKVPKEFTDAVKPTEVVVGHIVKNNHTVDLVGKVTEWCPKYDDSRPNGKAFRHTADAGYMHTTRVTIIDDTDAVYS